MRKTNKEKTDFTISNSIHILGNIIYGRRDFWIKIANLESGFLKNELDKIKIRNPIYVGGLARSGSTIILEILSHYEGVVSHRYKDFPPVYTPYLWNWFLKWMFLKKTKPVERSHRDRIYITPESPEAMEEILWMSFFDYIHNPNKCNILDKNNKNSTFNNFYKDHIKKLLLIRKGTRYLAKNNYNISRLEYILDLFPDAKFVIPIRNPINHVASLLKQHALFCKEESKNTKALLYMQRIGHFEFGLDFRPINTGDTQQTQSIIDLFHNGEVIRGWARYWNQIYKFIANKLNKNPDLRKSSMIVKYNDFCKSPENTLKAIQNHCNLPEDNKIVLKYKDKIKPPQYYKVNFTKKEIDIIREETFNTAEIFNIF